MNQTNSRIDMLLGFSVTGRLQYQQGANNNLVQENEPLVFTRRILGRTYSLLSEGYRGLLTAGQTTNHTTTVTLEDRTSPATDTGLELSVQGAIGVVTKGTQAVFGYGVRYLARKI